MLIKDIYHSHIRTIRMDKTIKEAVAELISTKYNAFIVVDNDENVVGVLSLQDIAGATVPPEFKNNVTMASAMYRQGFFQETCREIENLLVKDIMRTNFVSVSLHDNIMAITADFLKNDLYVVPVIERGKLLGIITRSEIKHAIGVAMGIQEKQ